MRQGFYFALLILKMCDVFSLTSVFVLTIRYFIICNVNFFFFSVNIKFQSRELSFYDILLDIDCYISVEILLKVPLFQDAHFFRFLNNESVY